MGPRARALRWLLPADPDAERQGIADQGSRLPDRGGVAGTVTCQGRLIVWISTNHSRKDGRLIAECNDTLANDCGFWTEIYNQHGDPITENTIEFEDTEILRATLAHLEHRKEAER